MALSDSVRIAERRRPGAVAAHEEITQGPVRRVVNDPFQTIAPADRLHGYVARFFQDLEYLELCCPASSTTRIRTIVGPSDKSDRLAPEAETSSRGSTPGRFCQLAIASQCAPRVWEAPLRRAERCRGGTPLSVSPCWQRRPAEGTGSLLIIDTLGTGLAPPGLRGIITAESTRWPLACRVRFPMSPSNASVLAAQVRTGHCELSYRRLLHSCCARASVTGRTFSFQDHGPD